MTQRDRVCIGAVTLLVGLLAVTTGEAMHLEYVTSLGSRHAHPGLSEPPALPVTVEFGHDDTRLVLSRAPGTVEAWDITRGDLVRTHAAKCLIVHARHPDAIPIHTQDDPSPLIGPGPHAPVTTHAAAFV